MGQWDRWTWKTGVTIALIACLNGWAKPTAAQVFEARGPVTLPRTEIHRMVSGINGVDYELRLSLPRDYQSGSDVYGVMILLDADYSFGIARNIVEHLSDRDQLQPLIIVGVGYPDESGYRMNRTRDYTPWHSTEGGYGPAYQAHSGGGEVFQRVLEEEVLTWLDHEFRTSGERILVGHSYGGLFAAWTFLTRPELFTHYLPISPSLWYDGGRVFEVQELFAADVVGGLRPAPQARIYLSVGSREVNSQHNMVTDLGRFRDSLRSRAWDGVRVGHAVGDNETHNTILPRALSDGLRFLLDGF